MGTPCPIGSVARMSCTADALRVTMCTLGLCRADCHGRRRDREGKVDLSAFYSAFSPACFALLGLWLVAVQIRLPDWERHQNQGTGVVLAGSRCTSRCPA